MKGQGVTIFEQSSALKTIVRIKSEIPDSHSRWNLVLAKAVLSLCEEQHKDSCYVYAA